jgi:hypothetical protein
MTSRVAAVYCGEVPLLVNPYSPKYFHSPGHMIGIVEYHRKN